MEESYPFNECKNCKTIADCPHPDVEDNFFGTPMPPDSCLKPFEIMHNTTKKERAIHRCNQEN